MIWFVLLVGKIEGMRLYFVVSIIIGLRLEFDRICERVVLRSFGIGGLVLEGFFIWRDR